MLTIHLDETTLFINQQELLFPIPTEKLIRALGTADRILKFEANTIYVWDTLGLSAYEAQGANDHCIQSFEIYFQHEDFASCPKNPFSGLVLFNNKNAIAQFFEHPEIRQAAHEGGRQNALVTQHSYALFQGNFKNKQIECISFGAYSKPKAPEVLALAAEYAHFQQLWTAWINAITQKVPKQNEYYNLKHGIQSSDIRNAQAYSDMPMPEILINFYKVHNVDWDPVTAVFTFLVEGMSYDLLPFEDIYQHWQNNVELNTEENLDPSNYPDFDVRTKINDYTNILWIPFAESREGDYLMLDLDPSPRGKYGQIIELQNESWERNVIANSLEALIQMTIQQLNDPEDDRYEFILENG